MKVIGYANTALSDFYGQTMHVVFKTASMSGVTKIPNLPPALATINKHNLQPKKAAG
jgi:hypothetical protein